MAISYTPQIRQEKRSRRGCLIKVENRSRYEIYYCILDALRRNRLENINLGFRIISAQSDISYNRFLRSIKSLSRLGMVDKDKAGYFVTDAGLDYLREFHELLECFVP